MGRRPGPPGCLTAGPLGPNDPGSGPEAEAGRERLGFEGGPPAEPGLGPCGACCRPPDMLL